MQSLELYLVALGIAGMCGVSAVQDPLQAQQHNRAPAHNGVPASVCGPCGPRAARIGQRRGTAAGKMQSGKCRDRGGRAHIQGRSMVSAAA